MSSDDRPRIRSTRRDFLRDAAFGLPAIAAADLLLRGGHLQAAPADGAGRVRPALRAQGPARHPHLPRRRPEPGRLVRLQARAGEIPRQGHAGGASARPTPSSARSGRLHKSHYAFRRRGQSGLWVSDLFPQIAGVADELTVINSMVAETANHIPGTFQANTGFRQMGFPAMGAWLSYGLGSENESLPGFVVLPDARGIPNAAGGAFNWTSGFLPAEHQGVAFNTRGGPPVRDLQPAGGARPETQRARLELLKELDAIHLEEQAADRSL